MTRKPMSRVSIRNVDDNIEAQLIALMCLPIDESYAGWTHKKRANKAIELVCVDTIASETI